MQLFPTFKSAWTHVQGTWQDVKSVSGSAQEAHRERMLTATANLLKESSAIVTQSVRYFEKQNNAIHAKGGKLPMVKGFRKPYLPPIPADKDLRIEQKALTPERKPLQVHLLSTIARAINNASVVLDGTGDVEKQAYAKQGHLICEGLTDAQGILESNLEGAWRPGINYNEWWEGVCKTLPATDQTLIQTNLIKAWTFVHSRLPVGASAPFPPNAKRSLLSAISLTRCQIAGTQPIAIEQGKMSQFLQKYENKVSIASGLSAAGMSTGILLAASGHTPGMIASALSTGVITGWTIFKSVKKSIKESRTEFKEMDM